MASASVAGASAPVASRQPEPAHAMADFHLVRERVHAWNTEPLDHDAEHAGASIVLRLEGRVIGRGTEMGEGCLDRALSAAMDEAEERLPVARDALWARNVRALADRITISLELAGPLVPFEPDSLIDASLEVAPGREGVAVRLEERTEAIFPGTMLATLTEPASALASLLATIGGRPALAMQSPKQMRERLGVVIYRFEVTHLAQTGAGESPIFLQRGGRVVDRAQITADLLLEMGDGMARHLIRRTEPGEGDGLRLRGTLNPVDGTTRRTRAGTLQHALVALALVEYASTPGVRHKAPALRTARGILEELAARTIDDEPDRDPDDAPARDGRISLGEAALVAGVIARLRAEGGGGALDELDDGLGALEARSAERVRTAAEDPSEIPEAVRGVVAYALAARWALVGDRREQPRALDALLELMLREGDAARMVGQMPWLGWALTLRSEGAESVRGAVLLRRVRELVWAHQLDERDTGFEARDLAGGIVFTRSRMPLPTWQTTRPLAFIASMLGDARLTPEGEALGEVSRLVDSLRFVRQLAADEATGHMYRSPARARWGIRSALWDQRMRPEASAMGLLTVAESLESLDAIGRRHRARDAGGGVSQPR